MGKPKNIKEFHFERLPTNVVRKIVKKVPLNCRWDLALSSIDLKKIISFNDRYKHKMVIRGEKVRISEKIKITLKNFTKFILNFLISLKLCFLARQHLRFNNGK